MRGSEKLKRTLDINKSAQGILLKALVLYNILVAFVYWRKGTSYSRFAILSLVEAVSTAFIFKLCKPKIVKENGTAKLVDVTPISAPGAVSFCWDVLFWGLVGKALVAFNWRWLWVYCGIPVSFFFEFLYRPYKKLKGS